MFGIAGIVAGIVLIVLGFLAAFVLPGPDSYQPGSFSVVFVLAGMFMMVMGALLIFL